MVLTKLALTCVLLAVGQAPQGVPAIYTNLRSGRIPQSVNPQRFAEIRELQLFMSSDKGRTWNQVDKITPDKEGFTYFTPSDGEYWYHVVLITQQGKQEPSDLYSTPPMMRLVVDTKPPEMKITSAERKGEELVVSWTVTEAHPDPQQLKLEYRTADSSQWTPITLKAGPNGTAKTRLNSAAPLVVRMQFKDLANNPAIAETQVSGTSIAVAGYGGQTVAQKPPEPAPPDMPLLPPGSEKVATPGIPPAPPASAPIVPAAPPNTGSVVAAPPAPPQAPNVAKTTPAIASTTDTTQGSPVSPPPGSPTRPMPELQVVSDPEIVLEYEVSKVGPSGVGKVEVWITRDAGANWIRFAEDPDASQATNGGKYKRTLMLPGEGLYGISMVVKSKAGMGKPGPRSGEVPEILLEVDTTPPEAQLLPLVPDGQQRETLLLSWTARDKNLAATPIMLEWAERPAGPWQVIGVNLPNNGRYPWRLPPNLPSHVYLKLTARDSAGNAAVAVTREAQLVDLSEPEGRLLRVIPANKK